ncbi:Carbonic anhydrase [Roseimaritima multifibrata]|uniref:Carbonic anhydrase n=1 Tax=Roseimaritima multifibrata TaxID=1930274 RepID=A0A517MKM8_9BACT|nr:SulP family inorganic anion transporter [Roseimaritima multifibrata]QDS95439.1 Carbonic anhydrase [Roseimaritima multifibrata]
MTNETPGETSAVAEDSLQSMLKPANLGKDLIAGVVVALVALPLCLGIALASGADPMSGLIAGIVGGIVVGVLSGSSTSVSGPAAGLVAIVAAQISSLGFEGFLLAVVIGGLLQVALGVAKAGALSAFFPSSVIRGLLAAIGVLLILKQIPHLFGHDSDPEGEMSFWQTDGENTFSSVFYSLVGDIHEGVMVIGFACIAVLVLWEKIPLLKKTQVPGPLVAVVLGIVLNELFKTRSESWVAANEHLVQLPIASSFAEFKGFFVFPDFALLANPAVYLGGVTIAIVASLETLLNLEAVDKIDPKHRNSPPSRELVAQGVGNMVSGFIGGLPITSVIVRGSVNVNAGGNSKLSAIFHGGLLLGSVVLLPGLLNRIPLAALAAILLVTGFKLASPALFKKMWNEGRYQFIPFIVTLVAIVATDLLIGILIGLGVSLLFILNSNLRRPIRRVVESRLGGDVLHVELANQVSFLNRAALDRIFQQAPRDTHILIDASDTDYIDPDVLGMIRDFKGNVAPARGVRVSLRGFRARYGLQDEIQFADYSTRELQDKASAEQVLEMLKEGNRRFVTGQRLNRDFGRQIHATAKGQNPIAAVLSCIDSRVPAELVFDLGVGDIFSVRVAGNVIGSYTLGSIEYGVGVAGVKLVLVMGHTRCGAVTSSVGLLASGQDAKEATGCAHLPVIVDEIIASIDPSELQVLKQSKEEPSEDYVDSIAKKNVLRTVEQIIERSEVIRRGVEEGRVVVAGALYDVNTGRIEFYPLNSLAAQT